MPNIRRVGEGFEIEVGPPERWVPFDGTTLRLPKDPPGVRRRTPEEAIEAYRKAKRKYEETVWAKRRKARYERTEKARERKKRYRESEHGRTKIEEYDASKRGRETHRERSRRYRERSA